eukprot:417137_1
MGLRLHGCIPTVIITVIVATFVPCMAANIVLNVKEWWRQRSLGQHECPEKCVKLVLSDIDGSIVFTYAKGSVAEKALNARALTGKVLSLPVSQTGRCGFITMNTLKLCGSVREKGVPLILISSTRYSTFASRLPYLPFADAYVIENGGRIFFPKPNSCRTLCKGNQIYPIGPLEEDLEVFTTFQSVSCIYNCHLNVYRTPYFTILSFAAAPNVEYTSTLRMTFPHILTIAFSHFLSSRKTWAGGADCLMGAEMELRRTFSHRGRELGHCGMYTDTWYLQDAELIHTSTTP